MPRPLKSLFVGHVVSTVPEIGCAGIKNGALLARAAAAGFDVFVTVDQKLRHEQNLAALPVSVIVIIAKSNKIDDVAPAVPSVLRALSTLLPRGFIEVSART
ncbi:MAG: hypothetical protein ACREJC_10985 [Tepidisphaeraceae bacterium]